MSMRPSHLKGGIRRASTGGERSPTAWRQDGPAPARGALLNTVRTSTVQARQHAYCASVHGSMRRAVHTACMYMRMRLAYTRACERRGVPFAACRCAWAMLLHPSHYAYAPLPHPTFRSVPLHTAHVTCTCSVSVRAGPQIVRVHHARAGLRLYTCSMHAQHQHAPSRSRCATSTRSGTGSR